MPRAPFLFFPNKTKKSKNSERTGNAVCFDVILSVYKCLPDERLHFDSLCTRKYFCLECLSWKKPR